MPALIMHAPAVLPLWVAELTDEDGARVLVLNNDDDLVFELPGGITPKTLAWARQLTLLYNEDFTGRKAQ